MKKILFVCTGNTCRSPMAEALMCHIAQEQNIQVEVRSAGVCAAGGSLASSQAIQVLKEKGIDHRHRAQPLNSELVEWADIILTMTSHHKLSVVYDFPEGAEKVYTLKEYANLDRQLDKWRRELDHLYVEMESKRAEIQARFSLKADDPWPEAAEKAWREEIKPLFRREKELLKRLESGRVSLDIGDPFGGSVEIYRRCADELERELRKIVKKWKSES